MLFLARVIIGWVKMVEVVVMGSVVEAGEVEWEKWRHRRTEVAGDICV